jgi:ubiquinone/menaquinone biosynthesis C-methylase UbiE
MSETLREEFNRWAQDGRGAGLEAHHRTFLEQMIPLMGVETRDRILDIGCGEGWASRTLGAIATEGLVVGLDASDAMIHNARVKSVEFDNILYIWGSTEQIPWQEKYFTKAICIESFYYFEEPEKALHEIYRVLAPGGRLWILDHLSKENEASLRWIPKLNVPVQVRSAEEYAQILAECGFEPQPHRMIPDRSPLEWESSTFSAEELQRFRERGALLLSARRPEE